MKKTLCLICAGLLMVGCGSSQNADQAMVKKQKPSAREADANRLIEQGKEYIKDGDVLNAIQTFDEVIKRNPRNAQGYMILGETYLRLKSYDRAINTFTGALAVDPENGRAHYLASITYSLINRREEAVRHAQRSIEIFQDQEDRENFVKSVALLQSLAVAKN